MNSYFILNSVLLGIGLAMDAFSVSIVNTMNDPGMKMRHMVNMAAVYAAFQFAMPLTGWFLVHTAARYFRIFERAVPWIALCLLLFLGGKMLLEGVRKDAAEEIEKELEEEQKERRKLGRWTLAVQGIATSIDALSVGFTIYSYNAAMACMASFLIGIVTFGICLAGARIGQRVGKWVMNFASILGGIILIGIGIEIFVRGI